MKILSFLMFLVFILGGLGEKFTNLTLVSGFLIALFCLFVLFLKKEIKFPKFFNLYIFFIVLFQISLLWSANILKSIPYLFMFVVGGMLWLLAYNLDKKFEEFFFKGILILTAFFTILYFSTILGFNYKESLTLFVAEPVFKNNNHLGDFWAITLLLLFRNTKKVKLNRFLVLLGVVIILISTSRSAYVSLAAGAIYLFFEDNFKKKEKSNKKLWISILVLVLLFAATSIFKGAFFTRPYYLQSIRGFVEKPLGVGMGNFLEISRMMALRTSRPWEVAYLSHNIITEVLSGMGILSLSFIGWIVAVTYEVLKKTNKNNIVYGVVFVALLVNFQIDVMYAIPTTLWIFFLSLGFFQQRA